MSIQENEAVASLKILAAIARADGTVHNDERKSLAAALESLELGVTVKVGDLLDGSAAIDVAAELGTLKSPEAREQIYRSAFFMAHADGACTKEEQDILDLIARETAVPPEQKAALERMFVPVRASLAPRAGLKKIDDPAARTAQVKKDVLKYAAVTAVLGAFPIPGLAIATDLGVIALQLKMIRDLGQYWGHALDRNGARSLLYGLGLGTGARLAVNNLAKLLPGWGSAVGATTSFASTYALGAVMEKFFDADAQGDITALKADFKAAEKEGKKTYAEHKDEIGEKERANKETLAKLTEDVAEGRISPEEMEQRLGELA